ncbi:MAG: UDP-N-acetylmuramoyl-tripeptide--D-alanyl-D-alanine ligase, partial [Ignavibacteria bacterium]|nr:UDP-N-acetylmuramoyl-tripeptide--D-alanyl-D-alanine ligase [Ignavibacteria bacterium]
MKKITITLNDIFQLPSAVIYNPDNFKPFSAVTIDSRNVPANSLFVAIKGEKFDGHKFIKDAVNKGAAAILINEKMLNKIDDVNTVIITVNDTTTALGNLAKIWRSKLSTKIIAITGSNGKTSTKEILALLLSEKYKVNKTLVNNNNHIGVPLTLFATSNKHDLLVLELGTNHFGETKYSAGISKPDYALITNIGNSHLEFLKNK